MGANSNIEWTDHTFNPWRGCTKVSPGCTHCYAETMSHRNPGTLGIWGDKGTRVVAAESYWKQPLKWNREAKEAGERRRVFCASLADVFEDRDDVYEARHRLFDLIDVTSDLDWLLLTKRPENFDKFLPWCSDHAGEYRERFWPHVWLGVSVENQQAAIERIPRLARIPAAVRFLSIEPLLGLINLEPFLWDTSPHREGWPYEKRNWIQWVIVGGESGPGARPMHHKWALSIRDECVAAGVPFHFKQWGDVMSCWNPDMPGDTYREIDARINLAGYGGNEWFRVGNKVAGRSLDGRTWDQFPTIAEAITS